MPNCTYCKGTLEPGSLRAGGAYGAFVSWVPTGREHAFDGLMALGVLSGVTFPGYHCPSCKTFLVYYESESKASRTAPDPGAES